MSAARPLSSGRRVLGSLVITLMATGALAPALAVALNAGREAQTREILRQAIVPSAPDAFSLQAASISCGQGPLPDIDERTAEQRGLSHVWSTHAAWLYAVRAETGDRLPIPPDSWGRCVLYRRGAVAAPMLVSAGANGLIETPLDAITAGGDDLVLVTR